MMYQGGIAMLDVKTNKVRTYKVPDQWQGPNTQESMVSPANWHVDGKVWTNNQEDHSILRVDVKTGEWENLGALKDPKGRTINGYDIPTDEQNNLYLLEFGGQDQDARDLGSGPAACAAAPRSFRRARRAVVRGIWFQRRRALRSENREDHGVADAGEMADAL
jgi:hypothetical protein